MSDKNPSITSHSAATDARAKYAAPTLSLLFVQSTATPKVGGFGEGTFASTSG